MPIVKTKAGTATKKTLRIRAEELLAKDKKKRGKIPARDLEKLVHDLQVHQIELQMQNEELRRAQWELEDSRSTYRDLYDFAPVGYFTLDLQGRITEANLTVAAMLQYDRSILTRKAFITMVHPESIGAFRLHWQRVVSTGSRQVAELKIKRRDGSFFHASLETIAVRDHEQKVIRLRSVLSDITGHKRAEEELQERTAEIMAQAELLDLAHDAIFSTLMDGTINFWNNGAREIYGWTKEEALGKIARDLLRTQFPLPLEEILAQVVREGRWEGELTHTRKNGEKIVVLSRWALRRDRRGRPSGLMIINHDITERQKLEAQLRQAQKMEALGTLAGGIAHDFNNLLMPIMINADLALLDMQDGKVPSAESLQLIRQGAKRGQELVKQIITFSRHKEQERKPVNLSALYRESLKFLRSTIPRTIEIKERFDDAPATVMGDPAQLNQILLNLANNSAYAMRNKGGVLEISLARVEMHGQALVDPARLPHGPYYQLTVKDNGTGMDPEVKEKAFDPFFTTKGPGEGTGMGLAVVDGIVKKHQGAITLESEEGKGTTVRVFLPVYEHSERQEEVSSSVAMPRGKERILLVDDEEVQARSMQVMLERLGYEVAAEIDPRKALETFRAGPSAFDLVITDQVMPHLKGEKLAREILSIRSNIPIILCTGFSDMVDEGVAREIGIRELTLKPFTMMELAGKIRRVLDGRGGSGG